MAPMGEYFFGALITTAHRCSVTSVFEVFLCYPFRIFVAQLVFGAFQMLPDKPFVPLARFPFERDAAGRPLTKPFRALDYLEENDNKSQYYTAPMYMSGNPANNGPDDRYEFPYIPLKTEEDVTHFPPLFPSHPFQMKKNSYSKGPIADLICFATCPQPVEVWGEGWKRHIATPHNHPCPNHLSLVIVSFQCPKRKQQEKGCIAPAPCRVMRRG